TTSAPIDPIVLDATPAVSGGNATQATFTTELFKGSYRAMIFAQPVAGTDTIAPFQTAAFNAAGGGASETQTVGLKSSGNVVALKLMDAAAAVPDNQIGSVAAYDASTLLALGSAAPSGGTATVNTGDVANVVVAVTSPAGSVLAVNSYTASPTMSATLNRYDVTGHVKPPGSATITQSGGSYGSVSASLQTGLGAYWDGFASTRITTAITDAQGTYDFKLFAGSYQLSALKVPSLPPSAPVSVAVAAAVPSQDVNIAAGGVIVGNLQDASHNNISGVSVAVYDANHQSAGTATTDASGNYSIQVQYGTYDVVVGGALNAGVAVSAAASTGTLNLTRFQITGRLTDSNQAPVAGKVFFGGGNVTSNSLGTYTINVVQGLNWFLFTPPTTSPSLGFAYETQAMVNADTVKSLQ
ncbi:MAG: carboxypeptidase-like regulatory domain-containing protein, partial [Myxococcales bacterium]|nr:carboxypeptidase-like regulatory domain-containing protein [Myxococcales bacterium]